MEEVKNQKLDNDSNNEMLNRWENNHKRGKFFAGLLIVGAGCLFLAREMGVLLPHWLFSWQMFEMTPTQC